jgi:transposase-like protein
MAKVQYITCPKCRRDYYLDKILFEQNKETIKLRCPFCKSEFFLEVAGNETKLAAEKR